MTHTHTDTHCTLTMQISKYNHVYVLHLHTSHSRIELSYTVPYENLWAENIFAIVEEAKYVQNT